MIEGPGFGQRHVVAFWIFAGLAIDYVFRCTLNVAIVAMVGIPKDEKTSHPHGEATSSGTCPLPAISNSSESINMLTNGEFDWDHTSQGVILSAFFYSYLATQIPGGLLAKKFSSRFLIGLSIAISSLLSIALPFCARTSFSLLVLNKLLHGAVMGVIYPACSHLLAYWAPNKERTILVCIPFSGYGIGMVIGSQLTGYLCENGFAGGWPSAFYIFGATGIFWTVGWFIFVRDSPRKHPFIKEIERNYIEAECHVDEDDDEDWKKIPWRKIILSMPFWAFMVAHFCSNWCLYTAMVSSPTYFKDVLHIPPTLNGIVNSLPYIVVFFSCLGSGIAADWLRKFTSTRNVRIFYYCGGSISAGVFLIALSFAKCDLVLVVFCLCVAVGSNGIAQNGWIVNHIDIAPRYAGMIISVSNTTASLAGVISPLLTGFVINEHSTVYTWRIVFILTAVINIVGSIVFALFADGEVQQWALSEKRKLSKGTTSAPVLTPVSDVSASLLQK